MNDQRMVDVGLLEVLTKAFSQQVRAFRNTTTGEVKHVLLNSECDDPSWEDVVVLPDVSNEDQDKLRAIIDGPGVEPVASNTKAAGEAIELVFDERNWPANPVAAARCGWEACLRTNTLYLAAPSAPAQEWPVLDKPAKVGGGRFHVGVSARLVVEAAQRHYEYEVTPEKEAERIARSAKAIDALLAPVQAVPDWQPIETAPKDGTEIIASNVSVAGGFMQVVAYDALYSAPWRAQEDYGYSERAFTHWMPRPQPPKAVCSKRNSPSLCEDNGRACDERAPQPPLSSDGGKSTAQSVACPTCHGEKGWESVASSTNYFWKECPDCKGTGKADQ